MSALRIQFPAISLETLYACPTVYQVLARNVRRLMFVVQRDGSRYFWEVIIITVNAVKS